MIEHEQYIFNQVASAVRASISPVFVAGDLSLIPETFPSVYFSEIDNVTHQPSIDGQGENAIIVTFQADVYSNLHPGRKAQCRSIMSVINDTMEGINFTRIMQMPLPMNDPTKYRLTARFRGVISNEELVYRR